MKSAKAATRYMKHDDDEADERDLVLLELQPEQLPLAGNGDVLAAQVERWAGFRREVGDICHWNRIRGSVMASRMSEISVPMMVSTEISRMSEPARYMSWRKQRAQQQRPGRRQAHDDRDDDLAGDDGGQDPAERRDQRVEREAHRVADAAARTPTCPWRAPW